MALIFVDCGADGPCPGIGRLTEFGAVEFRSKNFFHGVLYKGTTWIADPKPVFEDFQKWLKQNSQSRPIFVSDNPAFDWQWINYGFHKYIGKNPFGHSARRISDFYAGLVGDFNKTQNWKSLRVTPHDHNSVNDAMGNVEAMERLLAGERPKKL